MKERREEKRKTLEKKLQSNDGTMDRMEWKRKGEGTRTEERGREGGGGETMRTVERMEEMR